MITRNISSCDVLFNRRLGLALFDEPFGAGTGAILLDDVNCRGTETSLSNCPHRTWGEHDCNHNEDVSVMCVDELFIAGTALRCRTILVLFGSVTLLILLLFLLFCCCCCCSCCCWSPIRVFAVADIRLAGSPLAREGRLEVKVAGMWGTVCDDSFGDVDAGVACSMLGFGYVSSCEHFLIVFASNSGMSCNSTEAGITVYAIQAGDQLVDTAVLQGT